MKRILLLCAVLLVAAACSQMAPVRASTTAPAGCPNTQTVVRCVHMTGTAQPETGQQIADAPGTSGCRDTPWLVTDHQGAPMAWVNCYGLYSGGDGGLMPGGLLCVTYSVSATVACLTPQGELTLRPAGPHGPTGAAVTLTPRDISFLHRLEKKS